MSSVISRAISSLSRKAVSLAAKEARFLSPFAQGKSIFASSAVSNVKFMSAMNVGKDKSTLSVIKPVLTTTKNGYASLHTEGDRRFAELLQQEIEEEKQRSSALPTMSDGWKINFNGAEGTLRKNQEGDQIEVSFSLNGSVPPLPDEEEEMEGEQTDLTSYPDFSVKITKSGASKAVEFECYFPEDVQSGMTDESLSMFSIRSAIVHEGEVSDETYIIDTENLDPDVYSYFISYLADRSIDQQFAQEFVELTTAAEHKEYIKSLQKLKAFISGK